MLKKLTLPGKLLLSTGLILLALRGGGFGKIVHQIQSAQLEWFLAAIALFFFSHLLGSRQWQCLLTAEHIHLPWSRVLEYYFIGLFFNNFLISSMGGDVYRMVDIQRESGRGAAAVSTVFLDRFAGLFVMFTMALLSWPWILHTNAAGPRMQLFMVALIFIWGIATFILFNRTAAKPVAWMLRRLLPHRLTVPMKEIYNQIHGFARQRNLVFQILGLSMLVQSSRILTHFLLAKSMGVTLSPFIFFVIIPLIALSASLPISFGGLGVREKLGQILFGKVGVIPSTAFSIEFLAYIVSIITALPGGVLFAFRKRRNRKQISSLEGV